MRDIKCEASNKQMQDLDIFEAKVRDMEYEVFNEQMQDEDSSKAKVSMEAEASKQEDTVAKNL